jgi:hypothetical protein
MPQQVLVAGFDPTVYPSITSVTPSELLQMVQDATMAEDVGDIISSVDAPDVILNPELTTWRWAEVDIGTGKRTGRFYYYNDGWLLESTNDGANILDNSIPISKLTAEGADPGSIVVVDSDGINFTLQLPSSVFGIGSININSIIGGSPGQFVRTVGTTSQWSNLTSADLAGIPIPFANITKGTSKQFFRTKVDVSSTEWYTFVLSDYVAAGGISLLLLDTTGAVDGDVLTYNTVGGVNWAPAGGGTVTTYSQYAPQAIPASGAIVTYLHGMLSTPSYGDAKLVCVTANNGWAVGDYLDYRIVIESNASNDFPAFYVSWDNLNVYFSHALNTVGSVSFYDKDTRAPVPFVAAEWNVVVSATLYA